MKTQILITFFILTTIITYSQTTNSFEYTYDNAGNRTKRTLIHLPVTNNLKSNNKDSIAKKTDPITETLGDLIFTVYPNPTQGQLAVQIQNMPENASTRADVFDYSGRTIVGMEKVTDYTIIDLASQPTGNYILRIVVGGKAKEWKIVKE